MDGQRGASGGATDRRIRIGPANGAWWLVALTCVACGMGENAGEPPAEETPASFAAPPPSEWPTGGGSAVIPDAPLCPECTIRSRTLFTIGTGDGPGSLWGSGSLAVGGGGRLWHKDANRLPLVFEAEGAFRSEVGTSGEGPGQYLTAWPIAPLPGDSTLVVDARNGRAAVVTPLLEVARYLPLPFYAGQVLVLSWPSRLLLENSALSPASRDTPRLYLADFTDDPEASLLDWHGATAAGPGVLYPSHRLAHAQGGGFWAIETQGYAIARWTTLDEAPVTRIREAPWFHESRHVVGHAVEDPSGRLWVAIRAPRPGGDALTQAAIRAAFPGGTPQGAFEIPVSALPPAHLTQRTVIEVMDRDRARVFARATLEEYLVALLPDGRAAAYVEDELGIPRISILALEVVEP